MIMQFFNLNLDYENNNILSSPKFEHRTEFGNNNKNLPCAVARDHQSIFTMLLCHCLRIVQDLSLEALNTLFLMFFTRCLKNGFSNFQIQYHF